MVCRKTGNDPIRKRDLVNSIKKKKRFFRLLVGNGVCFCLERLSIRLAMSPPADGTGVGITTRSGFSGSTTGLTAGVVGMYTGTVGLKMFVKFAGPRLQNGQS
jgi:hypothetical protein